MNPLEEYKQEVAAQDAAYKELHGVIYTASGHLIRLLNAGRSWDESLEIIVDLADDIRVAAYADVIGDALPESQTAVATSLEAFLHRLSQDQGESDIEADKPKHIDFGCDPNDKSKYYHTDSSGKKHVFPCNEDEIALCWTCTIICPYRNSAYQGLPSKSQDELEPAFEDDCCCEECREESERMDINNGEAIGRVENLEDWS